jgi:hypothetical protein
MATSGRPKPPAGAVDLTTALLKRAVQLKVIMAGRGVEMNEATAFVPVAYDEVIGRYKLDHKPGLILVDEAHKAIWWLDRTRLNLGAVLPGAPAIALEAINRMLVKCNHREEVIILRRTAQTLEPMLVKAGGKTEVPGLYYNE